jgi:hypothetical protein
MRAFYRELVKRAFSQSIGPIDLWTGLAGAALGIVDHYWPAGQIMSAYAWQIPIYALAAVMVVRLILSPYWIAKENVARLTKLENELAVLKNEYAHSLRLERIDLEEKHGYDKETRELKTRTGVFAIRLRNTINRPISYEVKRISLDGIEQTNFLTKGEIISALSDTTFYSESKELDKSNLEGMVEAKIDIDISYGNPDQHSRLMSKLIKLECFSKSQNTRMLYERDSDVPIGS